MLALLLVLISCTDGNQSYINFALTTLSYYTQSLISGGNIATQSDNCLLPITPSDDTFNIWGYIYSQQFALFNDLDSTERYHVSQINDLSSKWLQSFTSASDASNEKAYESISDMLCHATRARISACDARPRRYACCSFAQYETWLRCAEILSRLIVEKYGDKCGTAMTTDAQIMSSFQQYLHETINHLPPDGVDGIGRQTAMITLAWALKGICDARNNDCAFLHDHSNHTYAQLEVLRHQNDLTFAVSRLCEL